MRMILFVRGIVITTIDTDNQGDLATKTAEAIFNTLQRARITSGEYDDLEVYLRRESDAKEMYSIKQRDYGVVAVTNIDLLIIEQDTINQLK